MSLTRRSDGSLELGGVVLADLVQDARIGTPSYVYDLDAITAGARALQAAFDGAPHLVAYAVKANSAGPIVKALVAEGCGADVVSGAELVLAMKCGVAPDAIVYSGVAKTDAELDIALGAGPKGIAAIQVESVEEIPRIAARARAASKIARVSLRLNPGVDAEALDTHSYIATGHDDAKFGVPVSSVPDALALLESADVKPFVALVGVGAHVGSQFTTTDAYVASARVVFDFAKSVRARFPLSYVDTGGGFGIDYGTGCPAAPPDFIRAARALQKEMGVEDLALWCEPGRSLVGSHGVLVATVIQQKASTKSNVARHWTMIDAGMNDLMRPALYQARHRIVALVDDAKSARRESRVVGPVCESSDDFGIHELPAGPIAAVALLDAGAYGYSMASRYNGRPLPSEVFLRGGKVAHVVSRRPIEDWIEDRLR
jgi:diaminopimelate decarboxylase